jgi:hypothetical protein
VRRERKIRNLLFFGSLERGRRICADDAILMIYFELNCIIAYLALITEILCIIINERTRLIFFPCKLYALAESETVVNLRH